MSGKQRYSFKCRFMYNNEPWSEIVEPDDPNFQGMLTFCDGFWLDDSMRLALRHEDQHIWIPPHKIEHIEKLVWVDGETA